MTMRARDKRVTFMRTFILKALEGVQPSGTYSVERRSILYSFSPPHRGHKIWPPRNSLRMCSTI
jgi:hypothetical protein